MSVKRELHVAMMKKVTMPKECVQTAITSTGGLRSPGTALTKNFTRVVCAKIATSTVIIRRKGKSCTLRIRILKVT